MKHLSLILLCAILIALSLPAFAQDPIGDDGHAYDKRLELATKMHEIWPMRTRMETVIDNVASNFDADKQNEIKASLRKAMDYKQLEEESTKAMATIFTEEELQAMIAFYGSEAGRAVSAKTADYELALRPIMMKMMDKAMLDLRTGQTQ
jgi:hypothetical protein